MTREGRKNIYNTIFGVSKVGSTPILLLYTQSTSNRSARGVESINIRCFLVHLNKRNALRKSLKLEVLVKLGRRLTSTYRTMKRTDETTSNEQFRQFLASVRQ